MTFDQFIETNCLLCGTQRCSPYDEDWHEGCPHYRKWRNDNPTEEVISND